MPQNPHICQILNKEICSVFSLDRRRDSFLICHGASEAYLYFSDHRLCLLTGEKQPRGLSVFFHKLRKIRVSDFFFQPVVFHLFYELGYCWEKIRIGSDLPLAVEIHYQNAEIQQGENFLSKKSRIKLRPVSAPSMAAYKKKFSACQRHLRSGNSYQINLTCAFEYSTDARPNSLHWMSALWKNPDCRGAYAHATSLPFLNQLFLSNTPESLFDLCPRGADFMLKARPIKGSLRWDGDLEQGKKRLFSSRKDQGELFMIADLLRHDLGRIERPNARVVQKQLPLSVPGILHQYALLEVLLSSQVNLLQILKALFPGGSITGAPKKRVMEILSEIEDSPRGLYTGSTVLLWRRRKTASINIRGAKIDFEKNLLRYGSGGGITLLSEVKKEHQEMILKVNSVLSLFN